MLQQPYTRLADLGMKFSHSIRCYQEFTGVGLALFFVLLLFFHQALAADQILSAADNIYSSPFYAADAPDGYKLPSNSVLFDQVYQFTPWRYFAWKSLREGVLPLWNPYSYTGTPFVATMQSAVFYPINLLLTLLPFEQTFVWSAIIRLWIAGISTFLLLRQYQVSRMPALIAAFSFMFCGFLITWLGHPHTNVAVWLPALIFFAERMIQARQREQTIINLVLLALVVAIQFTGGHMETSVNLLFACCLYYLIRWFQLIYPEFIGVRRKVGALLLITAPLILGTLGAAIQLLPFLEWLTLSDIFATRSARAFHFIDTNFMMHLLSLPVLLFPNIYNNPTWDYPYWFFLLRWSDYGTMALYVGTLTLLLACLALLKRSSSPHRALINAWAILALVSFGRAFSLPVFDWLNQLPGLDLGIAARLRLVISFSLCLLAAFGAELLLSDQIKSVQKLWLKLTSVVVAIGVAVLLASTILLPLLIPKIISYGRRAVEIEYASRATHSQPIEHYYAQVEQMVAGLASAFQAQNIAMYYPVIWAFAGFALLFFAARRQQYNLGVVRAIVLLLVIADLFTFGYGYNPTIGREAFYPHTPVVTYVEKPETLQRIIVLRQDLAPDAHMMYGLSDIRGLDYPVRYINHYFNLVPERIPWLPYGSIFAAAGSPLLQVLNLEYVLAANPEPLKNDHNLKKIEQVNGMYIGQVATPQPRAFMVYEALVRDNDEEIAQLLQEQPDAVFSRVILAQDHKQQEIPLVAQSTTGTPPTSDVTLISYENNQSLWRVRSDQDGYLFLSETYYPGWQAYVDDTRVDLYRANLAFRALFLPKGDHLVRLEYNPGSFRAGLYITALTLVVLFAFLQGSIRRQQVAQYAEQ